MHRLRRWARRPGFTTGAALILALGIGVTTAIFSVVNAVLLRPLPWPEPERLVAIYGVIPERRNDPSAAATWNRAPISWAAWRQLQAELADVGIWYRSSYIFGLPGVDTVEVWNVSASFPRLLGARPALGRFFRPEEDDDSSSQAVVISFECWQRRYGGRQDVVGQTATLALVAGEHVVRTIVGVLPPGFGLGGSAPEFLLPMGQRGRFALGNYAIARLSPDVSLAAAASLVEAIVARSATASAPRSSRVVSLADDVTGQARPQLWLLLSAAGLLLAITCANVAGLLMAEVPSRRHEMVVRSALGASRSSLVRQLITEHVMLAGIAGAGGLLLAFWLIPALVAVTPAELPGLSSAGLNVRVGLFAVAISGLAVVVFGTWPVLKLSSIGAAGVVSAATRHATLRRPAGQRVIVATELALAFVLLVSAALFGETIAGLTSRPLGFDPAGVAVVSIKVVQFPNVPPAPGQLRLFASWTHTAGLIERLTALPGVLSAAAVSTAPFAGGGRTTRLRPENRPRDEEQDIQSQVVSEGYFRTMGIPLVAGRDLRTGDRRSGIEDHHDAVVISDELSRRFFSGDAIGKRLVANPVGATEPFVYDVVGVAGNTKQRQFADPDPLALYFLASSYSSVSDLVIRTSGDATVLLPTIRRVIQDYDPRTLVTTTATMETLVARSVAEERFRARLSSLFGGAALLLSAVGMYGLAAREVARRRREIGVRTALGARPVDILSLVLIDAAMPVVAGISVGIPAALLVAQVLRSFLFGVSPMAPHVFVLSSSILGACAVVAVLAPARRASLIDPVVALRE